MLTSDGLRNLGSASAEDKETIAWVLSRMQIELDAYMRQGFNEPGDPSVHSLASRKVQLYLSSLLRELSSSH